MAPTIEEWWGCHSLADPFGLKSFVERVSGRHLQDRRRSQSKLGDHLIIETEVNPFHCLYQDALYFHTQSHRSLTRSVSEASRLARAALLFYVASSEAIVHQAAVELGRPDLFGLIADPRRPIPLFEAWRFLPAIVVGISGVPQDVERAPWPQFIELLSLRESWSYPGPPSDRKSYYYSSGTGFDPLEPHQVPSGVELSPSDLLYPKTGLPRDPYSLRPKHLDTVRGIIDSAITTLDRRIEGALTKDNRHRREITRLLEEKGPF